MTLSRPPLAFVAVLMLAVSACQPTDDNKEYVIPEGSACFINNMANEALVCVDGTRDDRKNCVKLKSAQVGFWKNFYGDREWRVYIRYNKKWNKCRHRTTDIRFVEKAWGAAANCKAFSFRTLRSPVSQSIKNTCPSLWDDKSDGMKEEIFIMTPAEK